MEGRKIITKAWLISLILMVQTIFFGGIVTNHHVVEPMENENPDRIHYEDIGAQQRGTRSVDNTDWYMFHRDTAHTGLADPSVSAPNTNDIAWTFPTASDIEASAAVVGDMVYFANVYGNCDEDCMIYGINETTGNYWNFTDIDYDGENSFRSSPAIADIQGYGNMLFIGSIGMGATPDFAYGLDANPDDNNDGVYDELDTDDGLVDLPDANYDLIWRTQLADYSSISSPLVAYIPSLGSHVVYVVGGQTLHALSAVDGSHIWDFTTGGYISTSPALGYNLLGNPVVFFASDDGFLYALDARGAGGSTTIRWQYNMGGWVDSSPTVVDDRVFIGSWGDGILHCLDATPEDGFDEGVTDIPGVDYDVIWTFDIGGDYIYSTPAVHNGVVFITGYNSGNIYALEENVSEPSTSIIWSYNIGGGFGYSSPAIADGKVFVGSKESHKVIALDEVGGGGTTTLIWEYETKGIVTASPAVANGKVYVGSEDNTFYVFGTGGTVNIKPYPPDLYSPQNTVIVTTSSPRFDWSDAVDKDGYIESYVIEIDDDPDFSSPEYTMADIPISHYFPPFIADGTYYWHVKSKDDKGAYSIWSWRWQFTVDTVNDPPIITVVSPNGGEVWAGAHNIWWSAFDPENEGLSFDIWLSDDSGSDYDILLTSNLGSHIREWRFETTYFPDGKTYRIMVTVRDVHGLESEDTSDTDFEINNTFGIIYDDWPQFHHHKNNTGFSPSSAPATNYTNWIFDTITEIDSSPAIFDGKVFIGNHNGTFYALDESTGEVIWQYDHIDVWSWCDTSPAIGYVSALNTYAVFFGLTISTSYNFFAMDIDGLSDGDDGILEATLPCSYNYNSDVLWAYKADGSGALSSSPTVYEDVIYIGLYPTDVSGYDSNLWAFDVNGYFDGDDGISDDIGSPEFRSADILWHFDSQTFAITSAPAVENIPGLGDVVFIGAAQGYWPSEMNDPNFFALDADPFDDPIDQGIDDPPGAGYDLIWELHLEDYVFSSPAVAYRNVYVGTYSSPEYNPGNSGSLYCLDAITGTTKWRYEVGPDDDIYASPAVWNDMVYIPVRTLDQTVYAFDATPEDGIDEGYDDPLGVQYDIIWAHELYASKISCSPAVANGMVFIGAGWQYYWGEMYCLDAVGDGSGDTREIWVYETSDFVYGSPSVANGCVYVADTEGYVYKFGAINGTDLTVNNKDITFSLPTPQENNTVVTIQVVVTNLGNMGASNVRVRFFDDLNNNGVEDVGEQIDADKIIGFVPAYGESIVSVTWTAKPIGYHKIYVIVDPLNTIYEIKEDNNIARSFFAVEAPSTLDMNYIVIRTESGGGGEIVGDRVYNVGATDIFYCAGYHNNAGYLEDVSATWESTDMGIATVTSPGISTTFTASDTNSGNVYVTATVTPMMNTTGVLTVNPPDIDYIIIRDMPDGEGSWVSANIYAVGDIDTFYCAGYNSTTGKYIGDVEAEWMSSNISLGTVTSFGSSTLFTASSTNYGDLFVTATYNGLTNKTGSLNILPPTIDYLIIRDAPDNLGAVVEDRIYAVGDSDTFYSAGYNNTAGYIQDVFSYWTSNNTGIATVTSPGISTTFTASTTKWGVFKITASYNLLTDETGSLTVLEPTPDFTIIRDQPGNTGEIVGDRIYSAGDSDTFYCAGYNNTVGYIGDVFAEWSSSNPTKGEVTSPGESTFFKASESSFGDVFVTASFNGVSNQTGKLTILYPTLDYIIIRDLPGDSGEIVGDRTYTVGDSDTFYCTGYNDTVGYLGTFYASWSCSDTSIAEVRTSGTSTTFTVSGENSGTVTVTASYEGKEDTTGLLTVLAPTVDYAIIKDIAGQNADGLTIDLKESTILYCAGYNYTIGFIGNLFVAWESLNFSVGSVGSPDSSTTFQSSNNEIGQTLISASYQGTIVATANIRVVDNKPPTADAGEDQIVSPGETVQFDASSSEDNVEIETYTWTFTDEGVPVELDGRLPSYEFSEPGRYEITLEVVDTSGNSDTDMVVVIVEENGKAPEPEEWWWLIILIFIIIAIVLILFFVMKKKKGKSICKNCGNEFFPKSEAEAALGLCPNCALKGAQVTQIPGQQPVLTSQVPTPTPPTAFKQTRRIKCPSCKNDFDIEVRGPGIMSVTCPVCKTSGQIKF